MKTNIKLLALVFLAMTSCAHKDSPSPEKTSEKSPSELVTEFVNSHFTYVDSFSIEKIEGPDSVYTPYRRLMACSYFASKNISMLYKYQNAIYDGENKKIYLDSIAMLVADMDTIRDRIITADIDNQFPKMASEPYNRLAVTVKYRLNGRLNEQVFYYDGDGLSISHCSADNFELIKKIDESLDEFSRVYNDF
jgi:hypothetical protein